MPKDPIAPETGAVFHRRPTAAYYVIPSVAVLFVAVLLSACGGSGGGREDTSTPRPSSTATPSPQYSAAPTHAELPLRVVVTLSVFADFVREMAGDHAELFTLLPPGADPLTYEPTPSDIEKIAAADIIFVNDTKPGVEGSILDVIESNKGENTKVIPFMPNVRSPRAGELGNPDITAAEAGDNPHLWLDPVTARVYANIVSDTFIIEDGINASFYNGNLTDYGKRLFQLRVDFTATVDKIPPDDRQLVTAHDVFVHMARSFGLEIVGFVAGSPGQTPSQREVADLTKEIEQRHVPAVFGEPQIGQATSVLEQIAADTNAKLCTLYSDAAGDPATTYIDMMRFDASELLRCLGGGGG